MNHLCSRFVCVPSPTRARAARLAAVFGIALSVFGLMLPQRSAGQDPQTQQNQQDSPSQSSAPVDSGAMSDTAQSDANPPVGVDTSGHADVTQTRNGRTTRKNLSVSPINPLVLTDPTRTNIPSSANRNGPQSSLPNSSPDSQSGESTNYPINYPMNYSSAGSLNAYTPPTNRLIPPVVTRQPDDYTIVTDPSAFGLNRYRRPLPLFGYDFFQPARQIILARRRALLRAVPITSGKLSGSRASNGPGQPSDSANSDNSAAAGQNADQNADDTGMSGQNSGSMDGSSLETNNPAGYGPENRRARINSADAAALGVGAALGAEAVSSGGLPGSAVDTASSRYSSDANGNYAGNNANDGFGGDTLNGDVTSDAVSRRRYPVTGGDGFPEDASAPMGSDIQFPGDSAPAQNGPINAVTGQITDPISSTLYSNVLASLPPNYQLQPGDVLTIRYSALALTPRELTTTVDLQGGIDVAGVGRISVAGRTAAEAEDTLRQRLARLYRNVDVSINLRQLRTIQVTVSGSAFAPGTYTIPATATAFNVLNAAGGPTPDGSLRDIRVLRGGRIAGTLDIYPLIGASGSSPGAKNGDIALQAGDNIYIPARLSEVAVEGEVRQPAIYELTPAETLRDALRYAGGVKPSGVDQNVHIDTVNRGTDRVIRDVNLRDKTQVAEVRVYDGDSIEVSSIRSILTNRVTIEGAVNQPGDYALTPGLTVADLIARARGPLYDAYLDRADLIRLNADNTTTLRSLSIAQALDGDPAQNIALKRFDTVRLYTRPQVAYLGRRLVTVRGAVQRPGLYTQSDNMRISDLLLDAGGPLPDAYLNRAVLLHQRGDGTYAYEYVSLQGIFSGNAEADLPVRDNDVLAVYRNGEAHFTPDHTVKILGNVVAPGLYPRGENMRLSDLMKLAGAFKPGGGTRVTIAHARRPSTDPILQVAPETVAYTAQQTVAAGTDLMLQDGDVVAVQGDGSLRDHPAVVTVTGMVNRPGPIIIQQGMHLSDAIKQAGGLRPEAFPQGAEFTRMSDSLATPEQLDLASVINRMSDLLNLSEYQRERAKANLAVIEAAGSAASGGSSSAIPGLGGSSAGNASNPNLAPLIAPLQQNNLVSPGRLLTPSQLQPNGAVAVQLVQALKRPTGLEDLLLKDGDTLVIPETPTTVQVVGAVFSARGVVYRPGQSLDYYVRLAGGYTPDAARDRIEVIHAGGGLIPADKAGALQPGDLILVPTKVLAEKISRSGGGFSEFFQGLVGSAFSLKVLTSVFGL